MFNRVTLAGSLARSVLKYRFRAVHMSAKSEAPFGRWESPITVDLLTGSTISIDFLRVQKSGTLYYTESRPFEAGRSVLMSMDKKAETSEVLTKESDVKTKVHEYGGIAFALSNESRSNALVYTENKDSRIYHIPDLGYPGTVEVLTEPAKHLRYAELAFHPTANLLVAVCEDHTIDEPSKVENYLVLIDIVQKTTKTIARGTDFYSYPTFSPDGHTLLWKEWSHPDMPWTTSRLLVADFDMSENSISNRRSLVVDGGQTSSAVTQPRFASDGTIIYCSDTSGFQELYKSVSPYNSSTRLTAEIRGDFADNDWRFGNASYAIDNIKREVVAKYHSPLAMPLLARIDIGNGSLASIEHPFLTIDAIDIAPDLANQLYIIGSTRDTKGLFSFNDATGKLVVLKSLVAGSAIDPEFLSLAQPLRIPTSTGKETFAFYYPPTSPTHQAPKDTLPPLLLRIHGGPTSFAPPVTSAQISYWTSRGYAMCMLNYGGSSGYGKAFMQSLDGNWGVVDVRDAIDTATWLGNNKYCDKDKMAIDGGSAGGYTVLAVLMQSDVFAAGCSLYGVSDLAALANDTHKFESQYLFKLVGGTPAEVPDIYRDRSPLFHAKTIKSPVMLQQGTEDRVVPINQAEKMVNEVKSAGGIVELLVFKGEGHGFRGEEAQRASLNGETQFFEKYLRL